MTFEKAKKMFFKMPLEKQIHMLQELIGDEIAELESQDDAEVYENFIETLEWEYDLLSGSSNWRVNEAFHEYGFVQENLVEKMEEWTN